LIADCGLRIADLLLIGDCSIEDLIADSQSPINPQSQNHQIDKSTINPQSQNQQIDKSTINPQSQNQQIDNQSAIRNPRSAM